MSKKEAKEKLVGSVSAISLSMGDFQKLAVAFDPEIPLMIRGRHGIGKSQSVYQIAAKLGLPVIERRLSQMTEGDIIGLPDLDAKTTQFRPVDWLIQACENPVVLFLDELNRAIKGVEQATFQLADSKAFYGHKLHPQTRIYIACNIGENYNVEQFDPAAISRYAVIDLDPTVEDWISWAQDNCDKSIVEFIRSNPHLLEHVGTFEPNMKYPDRRAWARLDSQLRVSGLYETPENRLFNHMCGALVGPAAGAAFWSFSQAREKDISAKEVLQSWEKAKARLPKPPQPQTPKVMEIAYKIHDYLLKETIDAAAIEQLKLFMEDAHSEAGLVIWQGLSENQVNLVNAYRGGVLKRLPALATGVQPGVLSIPRPEEKKATEAPVAAAEEAPKAEEQETEVAEEETAAPEVETTNTAAKPAKPAKKTKKTK